MTARGASGLSGGHRCRGLDPFDLIQLDPVASRPSQPSQTCAYDRARRCHDQRRVGEANLLSCSALRVMMQAARAPRLSSRLACTCASLLASICGPGLNAERPRRDSSSVPRSRLARARLGLARAICTLRSPCFLLHCRRPWRVRSMGQSAASMRPRFSASLAKAW